MTSTERQILPRTAPHLQSHRTVIERAIIVHPHLHVYISDAERDVNRILRDLALRPTYAPVENIPVVSRSRI